nr:MAG TPA: hypothetical protein [Caudoviricetes sp.]
MFSILHGSSCLSVNTGITHVSLHNIFYRNHTPKKFCLSI